MVLNYLIHKASVVLFAKNKFESAVNVCSKENCILFTDETEEPELTQ